MNKGTELGVEEERTRLAVVEELQLHGAPDVVGGGVLARDRLSEVIGDGAEDPRLDDAIHALPIGVGRR